MREAKEGRGDDHGVNLTHLRALAKRLKTQHELALQLWATGDTAARLLATLVCRRKSFAATELDVMIRGIRSPKLLDWFVVNVVKPSRHAQHIDVPSPRARKDSWLMPALVYNIRGCARSSLRCCS